MQKIATVFKAAALSAFIFSASARESSVYLGRRECASLLVQKIRESHPNGGQGLKIVTGDELRYAPGSWLEHVSTRLEDVDLTLNKEDNLDAIADALAMGDEARKTEILSTLKNKMGQQSSVSVPLVELIPPAARRLTDAVPECDGPNCHNASMQWHGLATYTVNTHSTWLPQILDIDFKRVPAGQKLRFGDLIVVRYKQGDKKIIAHTATYIDDNLVWHKASKSKLDPWTFESFDSALAFYAKKNDVEVTFYRRNPN